MEKEKGFTLVELLAVIIILGLLMLIVVPAVNKTIDKSRMKTLINSAQGLSRSVNILQGEYVIDNHIKELIFTYNNGVETSNVPGLKLEYNGKKPKDGSIIINEDGKVALAIHDGTYCVWKDVNSVEMKVSKKPIEECRDILNQGTDIACFEVVSIDDLYGDDYPSELVGTSVITKYDFENCPSDVVIPDQINGKDIVFIEEYAFSYCFYIQMSEDYSCDPDPENPMVPYNPYPITSVVLPSKLMEIGTAAFVFNKLSNIKFPNSIEYIAEGAFAHNKLTNATIPASIEYIDEFAFVCNPMLNFTFEGSSSSLYTSCEPPPES